MLIAAPLLNAQERCGDWHGQVADHPRLLMCPGEENAISRLVAEDEAMARIHRGIIDECNAMLQMQPLERVVEGPRLLKVSREALRRIFWLSYAYRMTCDKAYSERAVEEMLAVCSFDDWNPSHFLDVGEMVMAVAIGYDWLYEELTSAQRGLIRDSMWEKAFIPADNEDFAGFYNMSNNWNQVCCAGLLYGALAMYEEDPSKYQELIDLYVKSVPFAMASYAPDGGYPEGFNYWGYGTSFQVMMIAALESAMGTDFGLSAFPGFMDTPQFVRFMTAPGGECFNFSDAATRVPCNPSMFWFASKTGRMQDLWLERQYIDNLPDDFMDEAPRLFSEHRLLPALMVFASRLDMSGIRPPSDRCREFHGATPLFVYREGWKSSLDAYLGIKGGSPMTTHAHMDAGSFVYEYDGVRWSVDLGPQDYDYLESSGIALWDQSQEGQRWTVFRYGNEAHSTLSVEGERHVAKSSVPVTKVWSGRRRKGAELDMSGALGDGVTHASREIWLDAKDHLHVEDSIVVARDSLVLKWVMVTPAEAEVLSDDEIVLRKDGKTMRMKVDSSFGNVRLHVWPAEGTAPYDAPNPGIQRVGFTVLLPPGVSAGFEVKLVR